MEEKVNEKKVTATEFAEELQDEQMECVSGGHGDTGNGDTKNGEYVEVWPLLGGNQVMETRKMGSM